MKVVIAVALLYVIHNEPIPQPPEPKNIAQEIIDYIDMDQEYFDCDCVETYSMVPND